MNFHFLSELKTAVHNGSMAASTALDLLYQSFTAPEVVSSPTTPEDQAMLDSTAAAAEQAASEAEVAKNAAHEAAVAKLEAAMAHRSDDELADAAAVYAAHAELDALN